MVCDALAKGDKEAVYCLNPYSIGIWSATVSFVLDKEFDTSLNPYSIGIWSATHHISVFRSRLTCLNPYSIGIWSATKEKRKRESYATRS